MSIVLPTDNEDQGSKRMQLPRFPLRPRLVFGLVLTLASLTLILHPDPSSLLTVIRYEAPSSGEDGLRFLHPHEEEIGSSGWKWKGILPDKDRKPLVLVTGGAGQLGQSIVPRLAESYTVHILDIQPRPTSLPYSDSILYHRGSILPPSTALPSLMGTHSFSGIIHLAAISLDSWCAPKEVECRKVNEGGTRALMSQIDALRQKWRGEAPWVIHASSTDVFGPGRKEGERWPETALGRTKAAAEDVVEDISKQVGISATILRFADIYGYPQASSIPQSFIPSLLNNAVTSRPIQYSSDVAPMDLLHVDDAVEGILAAARRMEQKAGLPFKVEAIDLVSGKAWRAEELVERVRAETGSMSPIRDIGDHQPPPTRALRNSHAANILDWHPTITLDEGIRRSLLALAADIATYSRRYHSTHCEPSAEFPGPYGHTPKLTENERNKALWKLDGCTVNIGFEHAGWLHHLKCEDGKHCVADGEKVTALNWNSSVFVVRKVQNGLKERTARVMFEEEKGNGWLAVARDTREYGEVGLELCQKDGLQRADMEFDLEVAADTSYLRLSLPTGNQVHAVANVTAETTWFSLEAPDHLGSGHFDMRMNVLCCPSEGDWPLLLDDYESADVRFGSTGQIPFNSSRRLHICHRAEQAFRHASQQLFQLEAGTLVRRDTTMSSQPHDWAIKDLPACWNDCDSPTICFQTGDCRCVQAECPLRRENPLLTLRRAPAPGMETSNLGALKGYSGTLTKAVEQTDWHDVLLPTAREALAAHPEFIKVHVADGYEGQEAVESAKCHQLQDKHCFSADNIMYRAMRHISVPAEEAELVVLPVYQHCKDADFMLHDVMHHATTTIPGVSTREKRVGVVMTHDWGICIAFAWEIWSARDRHALYPDWILDNVLVMSVMGDYDSPCYRPHQDVVVPARSCQTNLLRDAFPTIDKIKPVAERTNLVTWAGTYWGTGKSDRLRLTCGRGGAGEKELVKGGGAQSNWDSWHYMDDLSNARFCPQPRGIAGWSPRTNDAIYAGCIPVLVAEGSHYPFADFLDWSKFSVRIAPTELDSVERILSEIPLENVEAMQANLALVRDAFLYSGDESPEEEIGRRGPMFFALHEAGMRLRTRYPTGK